MNKPASSLSSPLSLRAIQVSAIPHRQAEAGPLKHHA